jgi:hypothetical protein
MNASKRPLPFVLAATDHGSLIVNRNDYRMIDDNRGYGVGFQLLNYGRFDPKEVAFVLALLRRKRRHAGDGVVAIDCGANIGVHTVEWARAMHGWGRVYAFEAQKKNLLCARRQCSTQQLPQCHGAALRRGRTLRITGGP